MGTLRLATLEDRVFVTSGSILLELADGQVRTDDDFSDGLPLFAEVTGVVGRLPKAATLTLITSNGRIGWGEVYRWDKTHWKRASALPQGSLYYGMSEWSQDRQLALVVQGWPAQNPPKREFRLLRGKGAVPQLTAGSTAECTTLADPLGFRAFPSGEVVLIGARCGGEGGVVEWWASGARTSTVVALPGVRIDPDGMFDGKGVRASAHGDEKLIVGGGPFLIRLASDGVTLVKPPPGDVTAVAHTADGVAWVVAGGKVYRRAGESWESVPFADGGTEPVTGIAARGEDVFVTRPSSLYALAPPAGAAQALDITWRSEVRSIKIAPAARDWCETPFVLMYAFTRVTPADYDFPMSRAALKGQKQFEGVRLVVTEEGDKKYFGAFTTSVALGRQLVERIESQVKGSKPVLLCAQPRVVREIKMNFATGDVMP